MLALAAIAPASMASISYTGGIMLETFNSLSSTSVTGHFSSTAGVQNTLPGLASWDGAKIAGSGTGGMGFLADSGTSGTGALFSYAPTADLTDRALGAIASGTNAGAFGVEIVNNSGGMLTDVTISFDREQYRSSTTTQNTLTFAYGLSGGSATSTNYLSDASLTPFAAGNAVGMAAAATSAQITPPDVLGVNFTITGLSWAPGQSLFIRWSDFNDTGTDAGIAIDNFAFSAIPTPGSLALLGLGGLIVARRRRA
jgi:hypothetical protein